MNTSAMHGQGDDDGRGEGEKPAAGGKLFPEWSVEADEQILLAGLVAFAVLLLALGWGLFRSGDGTIETGPAVGSIGELQPAD